MPTDSRYKGDMMRALRIVATVALMAGIAQWAIRREKSLFGRLRSLMNPRDSES
jgi:hypothetical protein